MNMQQTALLSWQGRLVVSMLGVVVAQETSGMWVEGAQGALGASSSWMDLEWIGREALQHRSILFTSLVVGGLSGAMAVVTYAALLAWSWLRERLYTVVEIRHHDQLYNWLMDWLAAQQEVSERGARAFAQVHPDFHKVAKVSKSASIRFVPIDDGSLYMFRLHGSPVWISHYRQEGFHFTKGGPSGGEHRLRVMTLGRGHRVTNALFQLAFEHASSRLNGCTEVFVGQPHEQAEHSHWRRLEPRRARPLSTVVASSEPGPERILADMHAFLSREDWYAKRGVPYRRGYLFHGPPGCGKTTFVTAAAGMLNCPIYVLNLADPYLTDLALLKLVTDAQPRSILLAEDVDAAFHEVLGKPGGNAQRDGAHGGQLTFSGVLNALDGVAGQEGKIVVMTTNHPEKLDPALVRPGRVDMRAKFHCASRQGVEEIFLNFFQDGALTGEELRKLAKAFAEKCVDGALPIAAVQGHLMQFDDDPKQAAASSPPLADDCSSDETRVRQFAIPKGAGKARGGEEGEEE